jgi:O-antigen/teichoic acid export membrane protein
MYFAHTVGAATLGAYFLFIAYLDIFNLAADGGLGNAAVKRISEAEEADAYFTAYFSIRLVLTFLTLAGLILFNSYFVDLRSENVFCWLMLAIVVSFVSGSISSGIAGKERMGIRNTCAFIGNMLKVILQVLAVVLGYGAAGLAGGAVVGLLLAMLIELRFFDIRFVPFQWRHVRSLSAFSFWVFLTSGGVLVFSQLDTIMIGYFLGNEDVGLYRVVLQFSTAATFTTYALRTTLWPKVSRWGKSGRVELAEKALKKAFTYSLVLAIPVFVGGLALGDKLLYFFYGAEFSKGTFVLYVLLGVQIVNVFQFLLTMCLDAMDRPHESFKVTAVGIVANVLLNALLIPLMGILGATIATFTTMSLNAYLAKRALSRSMRIDMEWDSILNILKSSLAMFILILLFRMIIPLSNVWLTLTTVILGGTAYVYLLMKSDNYIFQEIRDVLGKLGKF